MAKTTGSFQTFDKIKTITAKVIFCHSLFRIISAVNSAWPFEKAGTIYYAGLKFSFVTAVLLREKVMARIS